MNTILLVLASYLTGSFPTAIIAGKWLKKIDIREHGSGNAGATNVFRILGYKAGLIVLLIDIFKGFLPVYFYSQWFLADTVPFSNLVYYQIMAGICAIAGHIWTIFAGFRGGKGVGTAAGVFLGLQPLPVLICLIVFIGVVAKSRFVSLGSMIAAFLLPVILMVQKFLLGAAVSTPSLLLGILLAALIIFTHRANIIRLIDGTENRLVFSKKKEA